MIFPFDFFNFHDFFNFQDIYFLSAPKSHQVFSLCKFVLRKEFLADSKVISDNLVSMLKVFDIIGVVLENTF